MPRFVGPRGTPGIARWAIERPSIHVLRRPCVVPPFGAVAKGAYLQGCRMEPAGIEPATSCLQSRRSPS
jgi:hypothetical protein